MRPLIIALALVIVALQWRLWFGENGLRERRQLSEKIAQQQQISEQLRDENKRLQLRIDDLRNGTKVLEETARRELGLIKEGETFFLYIPEEQQ